MAVLRAPLVLRLPGRDVSGAVREVQDPGFRRRARDQRLWVRCRDDGRLRIRQLSRYSPPAFAGHLRQDGADAVLAGEVRETVAARLFDGIFAVLTVFLSVVAVLVGVLGHDVTGVVVCGLGALAFLGTVLLTRMVRRRAFAADVERYRLLLGTWLGAESRPDAVLTDVPATDHRFAAPLLALLDRPDRGAPLGDCVREVGALADLLAAEGLPRDRAVQAVEGIAGEFQRSSPEERSEVLGRLRSQQSGV
jgi:hypothetical protein